MSDDNEERHQTPELDAVHEALDRLRARRLVLLAELAEIDAVLSPGKRRSSVNPWSKADGVKEQVYKFVASRGPEGATTEDLRRAGLLQRPEYPAQLVKQKRLRSEGAGHLRRFFAA